MTVFNKPLDFIPYREKTMCFTGHRPNKLAGYDRKNYAAFPEELSYALEAYVTRKGITRFITGGAQGFDQMAFDAVDLMKARRPEWQIKNILFIPFPGQERRWRSGAFNQKDYAVQIERADEVFFCSEDTDQADVRKALLYRNRCMVQSSCRVLALMTPDEAARGSFDPTGGTSACVRNARDAGILVDTCSFVPDSDGVIHLA